MPNDRLTSSDRVFSCPGLLLRLFRRRRRRRLVVVNLHVVALPRPRPSVHPDLSLLTLHMIRASYRIEDVYYRVRRGTYPDVVEDPYTYCILAG